MLTSKQRAYLRGLANPIETILSLIHISEPTRRS